MDDYKTLIEDIVQLAEERDALQQQLNTDNFESARSRIAALEAVIRSVDDWFNDLGDTRCPDGERLARLLDLAPSVVLDGMIREAQETAVREHAQTLAATMRAEFEKTIVDIQAENILLKRSTWEAQAKAVESARDAIMPPVNWNLRPDGTEMPGTRHIDEALRDIHVHLSEISAAYRKGGEVARD